MLRLNCVTPIFKELKSKYALDVLDTKNEQVIEALIWTAMLTLIVSRRIYSLVKNKTAQPEKMVRYTQSACKPVSPNDIWLLHAAS